MTIQHLVKGPGDDSFKFLASMYGVTGSAISQATFGGTGATLIYPWLEQNGGIRQSIAPQVPTGYHWSFAPGMVVNIPAGESQSPVYYDSGAVPGGPDVTVFYVDSPVVGETGSPSTGREPWNDAGEPVPDVDIADVDPGTGVGVTPIKAGIGGFGFGTLVILGLLAWAIMGGPGKPTRKRRKTRKKRKITRRKPRRRRNSYHQQFYGGDDD